ncbi:hypothetical protein, partial [Halorubrum distributum]|uniref:hypothetical protein n=1 Tax=Halorubrum distributum TaxID=29283 RepID=UPI0019553C2A
MSADLTLAPQTITVSKETDANLVDVDISEFDTITKVEITKPAGNPQTVSGKAGQYQSAIQLFYDSGANTPVTFDNLNADVSEYDVATF